jgi:hypothetical protein
MKRPNKPDAENPARASRLAIGFHWRGVSDPERSAKAVESLVPFDTVGLWERFTRDAE